MNEPKDVNCSKDMQNVWAAWLSLRMPSSVPKALIDFDPSHDYAGPEDIRLVAKLIPDSIMGVSIKYGAFWHDRGYEAGGDARMRKRWDREFLILIMICLFRGLKGWGLLKLIPGIVIALIYYRAVRLGGVGCFNYTPGCKPERVPWCITGIYNSIKGKRNKNEGKRK